MNTEHNTVYQESGENLEGVYVQMAPLSLHTFSAMESPQRNTQCRKTPWITQCP